MSDRAGLTVRDVAQLLGVAPSRRRQGSRNHVSNVFTKLHVDRSSAIIRAREAGLGRR